MIADLLRRDLAAAARHLEQALALDPANLDISRSAVKIARRLGRLDQAIALGEYLVARDPVNAEGHDDLAIAYSLRRSSGRGHRQSYRDDSACSRTCIGEHEMIGEVLLQKGDAKAALAEIEQEPDEELSPDRVGDGAITRWAGRPSPMPRWPS